MTLRALLPPLAALVALGCGRVTGLTRTESVLTATPDGLDFGAVAEGTTKAMAVKVENTGKTSVPVSLSLAAGSSPDFTLGEVPVRVEAGASFFLAVTFTPRGAGADEGALEIATGEATPMSVPLHGGPIGGALVFDPDPLDFKPTVGASATRTAQLKSTGLAAVTVTSVTVSPSGNPDFALVPVTVPARVLPGDAFTVTLEYSRSGTTTEGALDVTTDEADAGVRHLRLLPDPLPPCVGGTRTCYTTDAGTQGKGRCRAGAEACVSGFWSGVCSGEVTPAATDTCGNGLDDDCDGVVDQGCPATDACLRPGVTTVDAYEPNNTRAQSKIVSSPPSATTVHTYELTLPPGDEDWFEFSIPPSGSNANLKAEVSCLNWAASGCGSATPKVGLTLYYTDNTYSGLGLSPSTEGTDTGATGRAKVQNSGPISSSTGNQRWYVQVKSTSAVCTGEAINLTLTVTATNT